MRRHIPMTEGDARGDERGWRTMRTKENATAQNPRREATPPERGRADQSPELVCRGRAAFGAAAMTAVLVALTMFFVVLGPAA